MNKRSLPDSFSFSFYLFFSYPEFSQVQNHKFLPICLFHPIVFYSRKCVSAFQATGASFYLFYSRVLLLLAWKASFINSILKAIFRVSFFHLLAAAKRVTSSPVPSFATFVVTLLLPRESDTARRPAPRRELLLYYHFSAIFFCYENWKKKAAVF